jgi:hypothetical protein
MMQRAGVEDLYLFDLLHETINRIFEKCLGTAKLVLISGHQGLSAAFSLCACAEDLIGKLG